LSRFLNEVQVPILLMVTGVLFLTEYSGGQDFRRTWPILVIVFGLLKVVERLFAPARS
jgi:hypothetical protein